MWLPFVIVAILIAILTLLVYNRYASFTSHPLWVPITALTGFYLSFSIVFLIPIDVSSVSSSSTQSTTRVHPTEFSFSWAEHVRHL